MCNHCESSSVIAVEDYDPEIDEFCEFIPDPEDEDSFSEEEFICPEKPAYIIFESFVEDHLCEHHAKIVAEEEADSGFMTEAAGLGTSRIEPIESGEPVRCEYFDLLSPNGDACNAWATHALIVETESLLCAKHYEEYRKAED